ncbi:MAG: hypothetical protein OEV37_01770 [Candidatus Berkelbacteria bacterium]|nr:hypothetical protein [Candidatus Berkelbacteria bacterium]
MPQTKQCKQCSQEFQITDDDLEFLKKVSPILQGQTILISPPTLCPTCREIKRLCWRNERSLYKRKSDKSGREIVSIYSPDKTDYQVYDISEYQSDEFDPMSFGQEYDFSKSFFAQYDELLHKVPRKASNTTRNENSDYCNQTWQTKDSYLCFNVGYAENCLYCTEAFHVKNCVDCFDIRDCEYCYSCFDCVNCNKSKYIEHCRDCFECYFIYDCLGCKNVVLSSGLHNKQYVFENKQLTKEEYEERVKNIDFSSRAAMDELKKRFEELKKSAIHRENNNISSENCTGDYLIECKDCTDCYNALKSEGCKRVAGIDDASRDCRDMNIITEAELCYEGTSVTGHKNLLSVFVVYGSDNIYCNFCENCNNCFGCVGLNHKQYCILNKQYAKDEYEKLLAKTIEKMKEDNEWGEFFPMSISPFGYNEALVNAYHPKSKDEAKKLGAKWQDNDYSLQYQGEFYAPKDSIKEYVASNDEVKNLLNGVLECETSGKAFKVMPQEIAFYMEHNIPVPSKHSEIRYEELFKKRNPRKLHHRQCMCEESGHDHGGRCPVEFETTYAPDRPEKIYCENCYQKSVI